MNNDCRQNKSIEAKRKKELDHNFNVLNNEMKENLKKEKSLTEENDKLNKTISALEHKIKIFFK